MSYFSLLRDDALQGRGIQDKNASRVSLTANVKHKTVFPTRCKLVDPYHRSNHPRTGGRIERNQNISKGTRDAGIVEGTISIGPGERRENGEFILLILSRYLFLERVETVFLFDAVVWGGIVMIRRWWRFYRISMS
ncbi:hypothetical protein AVEN_226458-1 [Araneus ventricosus]|uniref:Uncharacterized protein n=1 Tax=Araneus ventricosus TaxID=182803 RepID=A0A4Y2NWG1_ARAVE|nr:hypothetical protein AVEN_226458-1 [Araneus ventricosus]